VTYADRVQNPAWVARTVLRSRLDVGANDRHNSCVAIPSVLALELELAIAGGPAVRTKPLPPWPRFETDEVETAAAVLRSGRVNYWTGNEGRSFEREFAAAIGTRFGIAVANGTVALEACLRALGVGSGDDVVVPSRTFVATASAVCHCGARPLFADVDRESGNVTRQTIEAMITPRTKAIIVVHLAGWPVDLLPIVDVCRERGLALIEDCAQAHGARIADRPVGSFGTLGAFSFCQDKIMTTGGEGGMIVTSDETLFRNAWAYKDHGKSWTAMYEREHPVGFRWVHETIGTNGRLTELQSAIGRLQLRKLDRWIAIRRRNGARLIERLRDIPALRVPAPPDPMVHAMYRCYAYLRPERLRSGWTRDRILAAIEAEGIPCRVGSCSEIHRERAFPTELHPTTPRTVAAELFDTALSFLVHPTLDDADMDDTAAAVEKVFSVATA